MNRNRQFEAFAAVEGVACAAADTFEGIVAGGDGSMSSGGFEE